MGYVDPEWVKEQFVAARLKKGVGLAVLDMLKAWEPVDLTPGDAKLALEVLAKVGLGHALVEENKEEVWVPAQPGQINVSDTVRTKFDAFGPERASENGRLCVVTAIRSGDIIIDSRDGKSPKIDGGHYRPNQLDKRIR
jgi:hypothetical protein